MRDPPLRTARRPDRGAHPCAGLFGRIAIGDWLTVLIAMASLAVLFKFKVSDPALVAATAVIGLLAFPILQPAWVFAR